MGLVIFITIFQYLLKLSVHVFIFFNFFENLGVSVISRPAWSPTQAHARPTPGESRPGRG